MRYQVLLRTAFLLFVAAMLAPTRASAQQYGVSASLTITQNKSPYLSDYGDGSANVMLVLGLNDVNRPSYDAHLKFRLVPVGSSSPMMASSPNYSAGPFTLTPGAPLILSGADLQDLLATQHLDLSGFGDNAALSAFRTSGRLPEGRYFFEVWAIDPERPEQQVSNVARTTISTILSDPPQWTAPRQGEIVSATDPQNVIFQWSPNNGVGAAPVTDTEYVLRIYQYGNNSNLDPMALVQSGGTLLEEVVTRSNMVVFNQTNTQLLPGQQYAIQVQARDVNQRSLFSNDGYSEARKFQFGVECTEPSLLVAEANTPFRASLSWYPGDANSHFKIRYRQTGIAEAQWFEEETYSASASLEGLREGAEYEYQVFPYCGTLTAPPSEVKQFRTPAQPESEIPLACGTNPAYDSIANQNPLASAGYGDIFDLGGFDLFVSEISGSNGSFSGEGEIFIPWLYTTMLVTFTDLRVNTDYVVIGGVARAVSDDLNAMEPQAQASGMMAANGPLNDSFCPDVPMEDEGNLFGGLDSASVQEISGTLDIPVTSLMDSVSTIMVNGQDTTIAMGSTLTLNEGDKVVIPGNAGGTYVVGPGGVVLTPNPAANMAGGGNEEPNELPTQMERRLDDMLKLSLIALVPPKVDEIGTHRTEVARLSDEVVQLIQSLVQANQTPTGFAEEFVGEGFSERITLRPQDFSPDASVDEIVIYNKHRLAYVEDQQLQYKTRYTEEGFTYLGGTEGAWELAEDSVVVGQLRDSITRMLGLQFSPEELDSLSASSYAKDLLRIVTSMVDQVLDCAANDRYLQELGWLSSDPSNQMLYAYAGEDAYFGRQFHFIGNYAVDNLWDNEPPMVLTPMERASLLAQAIKGNRFSKIVLQNDPKALATLPLGLSQSVGGKEYLIAMEDMVFTPTGATMNVFMALDPPFAQRTIAFAANQIGFSPAGITGDAETRLSLLMDIPIPLSSQVRFWVRGEGGNSYVTFDCSGFKSFSLQTSFEFCDQLIVKEDASGNRIEGEYVNATLLVQARGWDQFMGAVSIDRFQPADLNGWSFEVTDAYLDLSDLQNPPSMTFPEEYQDLDVMSVNPNLWRGFYLRSASVWLPEEFNKSNASGVRTSISATNLIIDDQGFTGTLTGENLIGLDEGSASGWAYSVDMVSVSFVQNSLRAGAFAGQVVLPISENEPLGYQGMIASGGNVSLTVSVPPTNSGGLDVPMFGVAKMNLSSGSQVTMVSTRDTLSGKRTFQASAMLHGSLEITAGQNTQANLPKLDFQGLCLNCPNGQRIGITEASLGREGESGKLGNFPISISRVTATSPAGAQNRLGIALDVAVNLGKPDQQGFSGATTLTIWAKPEMVGDRQKFKFDELDVGPLAIDITSPAMSLKGTVNFFEEDPIYGKGFYGSVETTFKGLDGTVGASVLFGNTGKYRYWFADAMVSLDNGIALGNTGLEVNGFSGGAYRHMRQAQGNDPQAGQAMAIGASGSGIKYLPDENMALGLKAGVFFSTLNPPPTPDLLTGDATFEIAFTKHGGLSYMQFRGNVEIAPEIEGLGDVAALADMASKLGGGGDAVAPNTGGPQGIVGSVVLTYDHENKVLDGNLEIYMNLAGVIRGGGARNRAGWAHLYFSQESWHIHAGTPSDPWNITMFGVSAQAYIMAGHGLPSPAAPPPAVASILDLQDLQATRDVQELGSGTGMAFGASLSINTGDLNFLMFYGSFGAGVGFDVMMTKYAGVTCQGRPGPIGINGWHATGQAYAYMQGSIGIKVDLAFVKGNFDIIDVAAAALLQSELPNPTWLRGTVGGRYNILNGLVQGSCNFQVEVGERCTMVGMAPPGSELSGIEVIAALTPANGETEVDVFVAPQAVFNMPVDRVFRLKGQDGVTYSYRIKLDRFTLKKGTNALMVDMEWNQEHDVLAMNPQELLPSETELELEVRLRFQKQEGGRWVDLKENGVAMVETSKLKFTSGPRPDYIPEDNVEYSYPLTNMANFYRDEYNKGYIKLDRPQGYLFNHSTEWRQVALFYPPSGEPLLTFASYNPSQDQVEFNIPADLAQNTVYELILRDIPISSPMLVDANVSEQTTAMDPMVANGDTLDITVTTKNVEGTLEREEEQDLYQLHFRSSRYTTLAAKFQSRNVTSTRLMAFAGAQAYPYQDFSWNEVLSQQELSGSNQHPPLVILEATHEDDYFQNHINPLIYAGFPQVSGIRMTNRNSIVFGIPPAKAVVFTRMALSNPQTASDLQLMSADASVGTNGGVNWMRLEYRPPPVYLGDFYDIKAQISDAFYSGARLNAAAKRIHQTRGPRTVYFGVYRVRASYYLPGSSTPNSTYTFNLDYQLQ